MSSNAFAAPLRLELKPARQRRYWRWLTHFAVLATLPMLQSPWLVVLVSVFVAISLYRTRLALPPALLWHSDGHWSLFEKGMTTTATLAGGAFVQPWLVIVPLQVGRHTRHIAIFPDEVPAAAFRHLRVGLRTRRGDQTEAGDVQL